MHVHKANLDFVFLITQNTLAIQVEMGNTPNNYMMEGEKSTEEYQIKEVVFAYTEYHTNQNHLEKVPIKKVKFQHVMEVVSGIPF